MQTFLPYPDFKRSIECLDNKRLGKQRVEAYQILNILLDRTDKKGWRHHPVVKMWTGYEEALQIYYNICLHEWIRRGFVNNMKFEPIAQFPIVWPYWLGNRRFHMSHRSNLLRKDPKFYGQYNWTDPDNLPYVWPKGRNDYGLST